MSFPAWPPHTKGTPHRHFHIRASRRQRLTPRQDPHNTRSAYRLTSSFPASRRHHRAYSPIIGPFQRALRWQLKDNRWATYNPISSGLHMLADDHPMPKEHHAIGSTSPVYTGNVLPITIFKTP
ncbi:uncharacterized protein LOC143816051 [Ranitomeya variabilis]|uniref:uncharacterized protein LOC143816051 n=1 Tax=Ranitomeya variabilis TaxID=490064 RepID=UPI00405680C7